MTADQAILGLKSGELVSANNTHRGVTLRVSLSVVEAIAKRGKFGESWDGVLRRILRVK